MRESLERRLAELRAELEAGRKLAAEMDARREALHQSMLRISGAAQVLEEVLVAEAAPSSSTEGPAADTAGQDAAALRAM